jgi:hypothetical protein
MEVRVMKITIGPTQAAVLALMTDCLTRTTREIKYSSFIPNPKDSVLSLVRRGYLDRIGTWIEDGHLAGLYQITCSGIDAALELGVAK